jgi:anti-sigma factor RsiW
LLTRSIFKNISLIAQRVSDCAACQRIHAENLALRSALTAADLRAHPSDDVLRRFDQAVRRAAGQDTVASFSSRVKLSRLALAAVALFAGWFFFAWVRSCHQLNIASAVLAAHIRSLQIDHLVDVRSSDRHTVKPWFQGVYQHGTHNVNVFLWPQHGVPDSFIKQEVLQGYRIRHWNNAGMMYWIVGDLDSSELLGLTRILGGTKTEDNRSRLE